MPLMELSFMTWNTRGSNSDEKLAAVRRLVNKHKPVIVGIQETKRSVVNSSVVRALWGSHPHNWIHIPSVGASGGVILVWDTNKVLVHECARGKFSVSVLASLVGSNEKWACTTLYGPCLANDQFNF